MYPGSNVASRCAERVPVEAVDDLGTGDLTGAPLPSGRRITDLSHVGGIEPGERDEQRADVPPCRSIVSPSPRVMVGVSRGTSMFVGELRQRQPRPDWPLTTTRTPPTVAACAGGRRRGQSREARDQQQRPPRDSQGVASGARASPAHRCALHSRDATLSRRVGRPRHRSGSARRAALSTAQRHEPGSRSL